MSSQKYPKFIASEIQGLVPIFSFLSCTNCLSQIHKKKANRKKEQRISQIKKEKKQHKNLGVVYFAHANACLAHAFAWSKLMKNIEKS